MSEYRYPTLQEAAALHNDFTALFQRPKETRPITFAEAMLTMLIKHGYYKIGEAPK